jgi:two-component system, NtrC family, sensor histidine kinase PilS
MSENTQENIYPCPFSKNYGIPSQQAWLLIKVYLVYRFVLGGVFIMLFYSRVGPSILGSHDQLLFVYSSLCYLFITVGSGVCVFRRLTAYTVQAQLLIFTDIVLLTLIMHACGGISSGVGVLLAVSIASGGLLIGGRCAMLFAAIASLAVLAEQVYSVQTHFTVTSSYTYAGMLGASFFTIALLSYILAQRTEKTVQLAHQQQLTIHTLEELNRYIIQHLQSGIIIMDANRQIQMSNGAALKLTHHTQMPHHLDDMSDSLKQAYEQWLDDPEQDFALILMDNQTEIQIRFMLLPTQHETFHMIILEDIALYNQRLQQSKLASLGQLTASIAHEIRNPLGAISHAGQLLSENPDLPPVDKRLTEIIQQHSQRVNRIIEDILQLSRRNASLRKKIELSKWLNDYLANFVLEQGIKIDAFHIAVETKPANALIDPGHLKQILDNLCLNALKYGRPELGKITLKIGAHHDMWQIDVIDQGTGISPGDKMHLFEPFFTTSSDGTGLGLYISRELAELNQANLSYRQTESGKSCFRLSLLNAEHTQIEI